MYMRTDVKVSFNELTQNVSLIQILLTKEALIRFVTKKNFG